MTANREGPQRSRPSVFRAVWVGALLGMLVPVVATLVHLSLTAADDWTAHDAWRAHRSHPGLWLIDIMPLVMATFGGVYAWTRLNLASREARERRLAVDALLRMAQQAVVVADAQDHIVEWSPGAEQLLEYAADDIIGEPLLQLIAPSHAEAFESEIVSRRRALGPGGRFVVQGVKRDKGRVDLEVSLATWQTSAGQMLGVVLHDISKQVLAERRLSEVEKNWRNIAMSSSDVLLLLDRAGTVIFANRGPLDLPLDQVIGKEISELAPELADVFATALRTVFETGEAYQHESHITSADGHAHSCWWRFAGQREDGDVVWAVLSISDISDRIARDLAVRRLANIVERTTDAVLATDAEGKIRTWNSGAELLWGWSAAEIIGQPLAVLCAPELLEEQAAIFERMRDGRHVAPYDTFGIAKNRRRLPLSVSVTATRDDAGQFEGISAVVRDVTRHLELQDALQHAKSVAETASQLKSAFLANMSHEVRTPLNGVVGIVDLLRTTTLTPEQQGYVETLLEAARALRVIVDDVLDFSKIEAGRIELETVEFDVSALVRSVVEMFRGAAEDNESELRLVLPARVPLRVMGDPNRLRQVLSNLVGNAVKFTKSGGIDVRVEANDGTGTKLDISVEVEDTGVGIGAEAQALIFQPFAQADGSITRRFGGTGLGLSICRKLVDLMGGRIGFSSQLGVGSTFWLELSLERARSSGPRRRTLPPPTPSRADLRWRVLVAEDNVINQKVVSAMLRGLGYHVDIAQHGREALERWQDGTYDLILMDCQMPVMSGFEAAEAIRKRELGGQTRIPIIAMTAQAYAQDRARCIEAGMDMHLAKPLTANELERALTQWLPIEAPPPIVSATIPTASSACVDARRLDQLVSDLGEGGHELLAELIRTFFSDFEGALARLEASAQARAWPQVANEAHRLRSSTSNLAATELSRLCTRIEECAKGTEPQASPVLIQRLRDEYPEVREALLEYARRPPPRPEGTREPALVNAAPETNRVSS
ncbi:MAG TPA: PAS domain S-box protein [Polyangiaceae bacterium]|nr:PAS domain S-box protein [Polyangiaceae bacterium]